MVKINIIKNIVIKTRSLWEKKEKINLGLKIRKIALEKIKNCELLKLSKSKYCTIL